MSSRDKRGSRRGRRTSSSVSSRKGTRKRETTNVSQHDDDSVMGLQHALLAFFLWVTYSPGALALPSHTCIICIILLSIFCLLRLSFVTLHSLLTPCNADYLLVLRCIFFFRFLTLRGIALWSCVNSLLPCNNFFLLCTTFLFCMHILLFFLVLQCMCLFSYQVYCYFLLLYAIHPLSASQYTIFFSLSNIVFLRYTIFLILHNTIFSFVHLRTLFVLILYHFFCCAAYYFLSCPTHSILFLPRAMLYFLLSCAIFFLLLPSTIFFSLFHYCPAQCYLPSFPFAYLFIALRNFLLLLLHAELIIYRFTSYIYFSYALHPVRLCPDPFFFIWSRDLRFSCSLYCPAISMPVAFPRLLLPLLFWYFFMSCALALLCIILAKYIFFSCFSYYFGRVHHFFFVRCVLAHLH